MVRTYFLFWFLMLIGFPIHAQDLDDVIYFKNGNKVSGMIIERLPSQNIKIRTKEGLVYSYNMEDIEKIRKEPSAGKRSLKTIPQNKKMTISGKNPTVAFLFSLLIAGGGQIYNGQYAKATLMLGIDIGASITAYDALSKRQVNSYGNVVVWNEKGLFIGSIAVVLINGIWSLIDATNNANRINKELGLTLNYNFARNIELALKPDYKFDGLNGRINPVMGVKLSVRIH